MEDFYGDLLSFIASRQEVVEAFAGRDLNWPLMTDGAIFTDGGTEEGLVFMPPVASAMFPATNVDGVLPLTMASAALSPPAALLPRLDLTGDFEAARVMPALSDGLPPLFSVAPDRERTLLTAERPLEDALPTASALLSEHVLAGHSIDSIFAENQRTIRAESGVPQIKIDVNGNIERDVDIEQLVRRLEARLREGLFAGTDLSYNY